MLRAFLTATVRSLFTSPTSNPGIQCTPPRRRLTLAEASTVAANMAEVSRFLPFYRPPLHHHRHVLAGYDELALDRRYSPDEMDYPNGMSTGALTPIPRRHRRSSSVSFSRQLSMGHPSSGYYDGYRSHNSPLIKFRAKGAFRSGISLSDAVAGARLSGGDYLKWNEMTPDSRGRVYLKVRVSSLFMFLMSTNTYGRRNAVERLHFADI